MPELPEEFSETLNMVCQSCMAKQPWDRPTAQQLADFANKVINGDSPIPTWKAAESFVSQTPGVAETPAPAPAPAPTPSPAPAMQQTVMQGAMQQTVMQAPMPQQTVMQTPMPQQPQENVYGAPAQPKKSDSISAGVWILTVIAGLAVGFLLNYFM